MNLKKRFAKVLFSERDIRERIYILLTIVANVAMVLAFLCGLIFGETMADVIGLGLAAVFFMVVNVLSIHFNKIELGASIIAAVIVFVILPFIFFTGGGIYGGAPIWFVFSAVFISMTIAGKRRFFFLISEAAVTAVCYIAAYYHKILVYNHTVLVAYQDSFMGVIMVGALISILVEFESTVYRNQAKRSEQQRKEIDDLNKAQNRFFSSMSHEIRTPINTIIGLNEMILREDISPEVADDAENIQSASKMLLHLINDILDMSKIESGRMELTVASYSVGKMLSDVVSMLWSRAKDKGLAFHVNVDPGIPTALYGDEVRIKQILTNMLSNAIKYTNEGSVTLNVQCENREDNKAWISFSVTDTGIGIKKENIPHLFSAFRRVEEENTHVIEGTGLGLSIVRQLTDLMGGTVNVNSVYTQGSTFVVEIPQEIADGTELGELDLETRHSMNHRSHYRRKFEAPRVKILIVDDNTANLMVTKKLLRETKMQIDTANSGAEALKCTLEKRYDLIFMDHLMPEMDGVECLQKIRSQTGGLCKESKVTALTANAGEENQAYYAKEGFDGYLLKPIQGEELEKEVIRLVLKDRVGFMAPVDIADGSVGLAYTRHTKKAVICITTESVCDLTRNELKRSKVRSIPYRIKTGNGVFYDGQEMDMRGILNYMDASGQTAQAIAPAVEEYEAFFAEALSEASHVIHISMSPAIHNSGYEAAVSAAASFNNVTVIDSGHCSAGMGILVMKAADMAMEGVPLEKVEEELLSMRERIRSMIFAGNTDYMVKGGQLSAMTGKIAATISSRPAVEIKNEKLHVRRLLPTEWQRGMEKFVPLAMEDPKQIDPGELYVVHVGLSEEELSRIMTKAMSRVRFEHIYCRKGSSGLSANCGPGTIGLMYMTKPR